MYQLRYWPIADLQKIEPAVGDASRRERRSDTPVWPAVRCAVGYNITLARRMPNHPLVMFGTDQVRVTLLRGRFRNWKELIGGVAANTQAGGGFDEDIVHDERERCTADNEGDRR